MSLIAVAVLLLITNWFFHDVYWKDWMAAFHQRKKCILGKHAGQWLGLSRLVSPVSTRKDLRRCSSFRR